MKVDVLNLKGEKTGIDIADEINLLNIPVVYLTAQTDDETANAAIKTAPYGYITKPFNNKDLEYNVSLAINKSLNNMGKIYKVEDKVEENSGVRLEAEVRRIGEF